MAAAAWSANGDTVGSFYDDGRKLEIKQLLDQRISVSEYGMSIQVRFGGRLPIPKTA